MLHYDCTMRSFIHWNLYQMDCWWIYWSFAWSIDWLTDSSIDLFVWMVDWLIDYSSDWLISLQQYFCSSIGWRLRLWCRVVRPPNWHVMPTSLSSAMPSLSFSPSSGLFRGYSSTDTCRFMNCWNSGFSLCEKILLFRLSYLSKLFNRLIVQLIDLLIYWFRSNDQRVLKNNFIYSILVAKFLIFAKTIHSVQIFFLFWEWFCIHGISSFRMNNVLFRKFFHFYK